MKGSEPFLMLLVTPVQVVRMSAIKCNEACYGMWRFQQKYI